MRLFNPTGKLLPCSQCPGNHKRAPEKDALLLKSLHSSRSLQSKRYEFCGTISANPRPFRKTASAPKILCSHNQETGIKCEPVHVILSSPQGDAPMRPIQAYVPKERILPSREIVKEGHVPMGLEGSGALWRGRDRDRDLGGAFQYSRRLTRLMDKP